MYEPMVESGKMAASMLKRFQGSMAGAVIGDCIGAVFEGKWGVLVGVEPVLDLVCKIDAAFKDEKSAKRLEGHWTFTDDTAMARSVAKSLIEHNGLSERSLAQRFADEYHKESGRGYGGSVVTVFKTLAETNCSDPFGPAKNQFDGQGSYGNGGAMRIGPAALFAHRKNYNFDKLMELTEKITLITHSHHQAILGAIVQCYAVNLALNTNQLDIDMFLDSLLDKIRPLENAYLADTPQEESSDNDDKGEKPNTYCSKLEKVRTFAKQEPLPSSEEVDDVLGTDVSAIDSVPAAVYCFLRGLKQIEDIPDHNPFERTIIYAISLGGDTDTIASMAAAIAGAYYGLDMLPQSWQHHCEGVKDALMDSELLLNLPS